jgi:hypothetical protein
MDMVKLRVWRLFEIHCFLSLSASKADEAQDKVAFHLQSEPISCSPLLYTQEIRTEEGEQKLNRELLQAYL